MFEVKLVWEGDQPAPWLTEQEAKPHRSEASSPPEYVASCWITLATIPRIGDIVSAPPSTALLQSQEELFAQQHPTRGPARAHYVTIRIQPGDQIVLHHDGSVFVHLYRYREEPDERAESDREFRVTSRLRPQRSV